MKSFHIFTFTILLISTQIFAQEVIEDSSNEKTNKKSSGSEYWDKHFGLTFGASRAIGIGTKDSRDYSFVNLTWNHSTKKINFNFEAEAYRRGAEYTLALDTNSKRSLESQRDFLQNKSKLNPLTPSEQNNLFDLNSKIDNLQDSFLFSQIESGIIYKEANIKVKPIDWLTFTLGYTTVVWGQTNVFSPIDYMLPIRSSNGSININKVDSRLPQQSLIIGIYPVKQLELLFYFFPQITLDNAVRGYFEKYNVENLDNAPTNPNSDDFISSQNVRYAFAYPTGNKQFQYAFRAMLYFDWFTLGFTFYEGWNQFGYTPNKSVSKVNGVTTPITGTSAPKEVDYYQIVSRPSLERLQNYGLELSIPIKIWKINFDVLSHIVSSAPDIDPQYDLNTKTDFNSRIIKASKDIVNLALMYNNGVLDYKKRETIIALEASVDGDLHFSTFGIVNVQNQFLDQYGSKLNDLVNVYNSVKYFNGPSSNLNTIPYLNVGRYLKTDKKSMVGFTAGFLGGLGAGAILYWGQQFFESFTFGVAFEYLVLFSSKEAQVTGYKLKTQGYPDIRFLAAYKF